MVIIAAIIWIISKRKFGSLLCGTLIICYKLIIFTCLLSDYQKIKIHIINSKRFCVEWKFRFFIDLVLCFWLYRRQYLYYTKKNMPSVSLAKLSPRLPPMIITTEHGTLKLKKITAHRADSSLANSRYARKQIKRNRQRKFGAVLRVLFLFKCYV